ncbi:uncharacterized protein METZ01_LOCUS153156 [marine metagenome]|uniref:Homoserine kinase n=1 Tax=marine metagenome TaxID=408172 RepID=A0A382AGQ3_9ZZZZ
MSSVKVYAPATIGNIGPGFDVLGLAIQGLGDTIEAREIPANDLIIEDIQNADNNISTDPLKNSAGIAAQKVLNLLASKQGVSLSISKGLPSGSGLGSSAASAVAGASAVNHLFGNQLSNEELLHAAMAGEYSVSGGYFADNVAPSIYGGATLTCSLDPLVVKPLGSISELIIILAIPRTQILTKESRQILPEKVELSDCIHNMANTASITAAFCNNDYNLLKDSLIDFIIEPVRSKLIPGFPDAKEAAFAAGAHGMSISGSGPTVFAITNTSRNATNIESAMKKAFNDNGIGCETLVTSPCIEGVTKIM